MVKVQTGLYFKFILTSEINERMLNEIDKTMKFEWEKEQVLFLSAMSSGAETKNQFSEANWTKNIDWRQLRIRIDIQNTKNEEK